MINPVITGSFKENIFAVSSHRSVRPENFKKINHNPVSEKVLIPEQKEIASRVFTGIPDNNRTIIFPDIVMDIDGRGYALSVKGVGARTPLYGSSPLDSPFKTDLSYNGRARSVTNELWFGEAPYGAQGEINANFALEITEMARGASINGFYICPVIEVNEFPDIEGISRTYWYRRFNGKYFQEQRLVPSNIRLYHQSELTLGQTTAGVLRAFNITSFEQLDTFIENYISSGIAALTLFARTLRHCKYGYEGLDYEDVWLDKDSVLASDGVIHFADIEGLNWDFAGQEIDLEKLIRMQFDRNFYEFMYGLDALLRERVRLKSACWTIEDFRSSLAARYEMALSKDPFVKCEYSSDGLDIAIKPQVHGGSVLIRVLDLR